MAEPDAPTDEHSPNAGPKLADERRFLQRLRERDEAAFNTLVRDHQGQVFRLLQRLLGDPAEAQDVAQEVFVSVFKSIDKFRGDSRLSTWIYRIATNHGKNRIKYLARRARDARRPLDEDTTTAGQVALATGGQVHRPDELVQGYQAQGHLRLALDSLDEEQRALVVLRDLEHMSYEDIQRVTGLPIGTVKSRLHRARMALHRSFASLQEGKT